MIDLIWARENIKDFVKHEANVLAVREEEKRYKDKPGYIPQLAVPSTITSGENQ